MSNRTRKRTRGGGGGTTAIVSFSPQLLPGYSFYTSGSRANVGSGAISTLTDAGGRPNFVAAGGGPTVSSGILTFDGTDDTCAQPAIVTDSRTLPLAGQIVLPRGSGSGANGGFTCTGIAGLPNGYYAIGNDGRGVEGDGSTTINASIVIMDLDLVNYTGVIVEDITLLSMGIASDTNSVQGVAYVPATNQIAFTTSGDDKVFYLNASTYAFEGASALGTVSGLNGLAYDQDTDSLVTSVVGNAIATWRNRVTGATGKLQTITATNATNDLMLYRPDRHTLWNCYGANGENGTVEELRASGMDESPVFSWVFDHCTAIEGVYLDDVKGKFLFPNDSGYHVAPPTPAIDVIRVYDNPGLPSVTVWPVDQSVQFYGIMSAASAPATNARCIISIGNAFSGVQGGAALLQVNGNNSQLQLTFQNQSAVFTLAAALSTKCIFFANLDCVTRVATIWINGATNPTSTTTITTSGPNYISPAPPVIGSDRGSARFAQAAITCVGAQVGQLTNRAKFEAFAAWDTGNQALLDPDSPYISVPPTTGPPPPRVPGQFATTDWTVLNAHTGGAVTVTISVVPSDRGAPITSIQYQVGAGSWTDIGGTAAGTYTISGLTDGVSVAIGLRAVNAVGNGAGSATKSVVPSTGYNPKTLAFIARFTVPPTLARKDTIDTLFNNGDANGWLTLLDSMVLIGADAQCSLLNWIAGAPDASLVNPTTAVTFTADRDWTTNGTDNYVDSGFSPTVSGVKYTQNSACAGYVSRKNGPYTNSAFGWFDGTDGMTLNPRTAGNICTWRVNDATSTNSGANSVGTGIFQLNRSAASGAGSKSLYHDGSLLTAANVASAAMNNFTFRAGGVTGALFQIVQVSGFWFGGSMNSTITAAMYTDVLAYMTTLGALP